MHSLPACIFMIAGQACWLVSQKSPFFDHRMAMYLVWIDITRKKEESYTMTKDIVIAQHNSSGL